MAGNTSPIFSRVGSIQGSRGPITSASPTPTDMSAQNAFGTPVFEADISNGGFIQRLRFKARGTNVTTVARIYICSEESRYLSSANTYVGTVSLTGSYTIGTLAGAGPYTATITGVTNTTGVANNMIIIGTSGTGIGIIPANTTVASFVANTSISITSPNPIAAGSLTSLTLWLPATIGTVTGTGPSTATITITSTAGLVQGMNVGGTSNSVAFLPPNTTITSITANTSIAVTCPSLMVAGTLTGLYTGPTMLPPITTVELSAAVATLLPGQYYAKVLASDQYGVESLPSVEATMIVPSGSQTNSITWSWTAVPSATKYELYVGGFSGGYTTSFYVTPTTNTGTITYKQTAAAPITSEQPSLVYESQNLFYGEISLPATTFAAAAANPDIDYPMNIALPPGHLVVVALGTAVAAGWDVVSIGGAY